MVKAFQVGKRYYQFRHDNGLQAECLFVDNNGFALLRCGENLSPFVPQWPGDWHIIPPKPRTGKGFMVAKWGHLNKQWFTTDPSMWKGDGYAIYPVEWTEVIPND
jgi:hypothetical protein